MELKETQSDLLQHDERFAEFLGSSFDASQFASKALSNKKTTPQEEIDALQSAIVSIEEQIQRLALEHREELLDNTAQLNVSGTSLHRLMLSVRSLQSVAARICAEVNEPYGKLCLKTQQLRNLYKTINLLRQTIHQIKITQRLKTEMEGDKQDILDLSKIARLIAEANTLNQETDLCGIHICEDNNRFVEKAFKDVKDKLMCLLQSGVESQSQAEIGGALQALHNMQELQAAVITRVRDMAGKVAHSFSCSLDAKKLSAHADNAGSFTSLLPNNAVQNLMWDQLKNSLDEFWEATISCWHLQKVLLKKKDPISHKSFIDLIGSEAGRILPLHEFWKSVITSLKDVFKGIEAMRGGVIKDSLVSNYPKLAALMENTLRSIAKDCTEQKHTSISEGDVNDFFLAVSPIEAEYLGTVQARVESLGMAAFPGGSRAPPSQVDLQSVIARIHEEIKFAREGGDRLTNLVAGVVGSVLLVMASQAETMAADRTLVGTIGTTCNPSQSRNISLSKSLEEVQRALILACSRLPARSMRILDGPLKKVQEVSYELLWPIFNAQTEITRKIIHNIHSLNFGAEDGAESQVTEASSYVNELSTSLRVFKQEIVSCCNLTSGPNGIQTSSQILLNGLAGVVLTYWVKQASLVRPLTNPGKLQLTKDAAEIENAVEQYLCSSNNGSKSNLAHAFLQMKAFKRLIFLEDVNELEADPSYKTHLPTTVIVHHLFSKCPAQIESPYVRNKISRVQYATWLEDNTDEEVFKLIRSTVVSGQQKLDSPNPIVDHIVSLIPDTKQS